MKRPTRIAIQVVLGGAFGVLAILALMMYSPYPRRPAPGVKEAKVVHGWLEAWASEHEGRLPDKVEDLTKIDIGADPAYFSEITEYRGAGKNICDMPKHALLLRYRGGRKGELEVRVSFEGSSTAKRPEEWSNAEATR